MNKTVNWPIVLRNPSIPSAFLYWVKHEIRKQGCFQYWWTYNDTWYAPLQWHPSLLKGHSIHVWIVCGRLFKGMAHSTHDHDSLVSRASPGLLRRRCWPARRMIAILDSDQWTHCQYNWEEKLSSKWIQKKTANYGKFKFSWSQSSSSTAWASCWGWFSRSMQINLY